MCQMRIPLGGVALLVFGMAVPMAAAAAQDQGPCSTNQGGMSRFGFYSGCRSGRHWAADPLHHAHHAGEGPAADRAQAIAESQSATGG